MGSSTMATSTSTPFLLLLLLLCFAISFENTSAQDTKDPATETDSPPETAPETAFEASPGTEITIHKMPFLPLTLPFPLPTFLLDALKYLISLFKLESFLTVERTALRNGLPTSFLFFLFVEILIGKSNFRILRIIGTLFTTFSGPVAPFFTQFLTVMLMLMIMSVRTSVTFSPDASEGAIFVHPSLT